MIYVRLCLNWFMDVKTNVSEIHAIVVVSRFNFINGRTTPSDFLIDSESSTVPENMNEQRAT